MRRSPLAGLAVVFVGLLAATRVTPTQASGSPPQTLVLTKGPIPAFAQDGDRIAWASTEPSGTCRWLVRVGTLAAGTQDAVSSANSPTCKSESGFDLGHTTHLALAGGRALWTLWEGGNNTYIRVVTGALGVKPDRQLDQLVFSNT